MPEHSDDMSGRKSVEKLRRVVLETLDRSAADIIAIHEGDPEAESEAAIVAENIKDRADLQYCEAFLSSYVEDTPSGNAGPYLAIARKWLELRKRID